MPRQDRNTPEYREKAAARMRAWRKENGDVHRAREKARYWKKKAENPDELRKKSAEQARQWRQKYPEKAKAAQVQYSKRNADRLRSRRLVKKYGISLDRWNEILDRQNNTCGICKQNADARGWCLDHHHTTGAVRGILCHPCNTAIGFFKEDADRLYAAIQYLNVSPA